ncbi:MAG: hypothetical protein AAFX03_00805 [Pseudomonadota bacterium]
MASSSATETVSSLPPPIDQWTRRAAYGLIALGAAAFIVIAWAALDIAYWRHDSIRYASENAILSKVQSEGRWLNYLTFDLARRVDPHLAWFANIALTAGGVFLIFRRLFDDALIAALLAVLIGLFPGLHAQNMWPAAVLPAALIFPISVLIVQRFSWWWAPVFAILQFGALPYFYFLLALAAVPLATRDTARGFVLGLGPGVVWGLGLIAGYVFASALNIWFFGAYGVELAEWRNPRPAEDLASLGANVARGADAVIVQVSTWLPASSLAVLAAVLALGLWRLAADREDRFGRPLRAGYGAMTAITPYLAIIVSGIYVQFRSLTPLATGLAATPLLLLPRRYQRIGAVTVVAALGIPSVLLTYQGVSWFSATTQVNMANLEKVLPRAPRAYRGVVIDASDWEAYFQGVRAQAPEGLERQVFMEALDRPGRLVAAFNEAGFKIARLCDVGRSPSCADFAGDAFAAADCSAQLTQICVVGVDQRNNLLVKLQR